MMKSKTLIVILLSVLCIVSCEQADKGFILEGQITGAENQRIILQTFSFPYINGTPRSTVIDTARSDAEGNFIIKNYLPERSICVLKVLGNDDYNLWLSLQDENVKLVSNISNPLETTTEGSTASAVLYNFIVNMNNMNASVMQNRMQYSKNMKDGQDSIAKVYMQKADDEVKNYFSYISTFADTTTEVSTAVLALEGFLYDEQFDKIKAVAEKRSITSDSSSLYMKELLEKIKKYESLQATEAAKSLVGKPAPEIVLQNPEGKEYKLSDLKGKYVLLDFWASWCGPCRKENPNIVETYNLFKDKGFTVFSVSLDENKDAWTKAIQKDDLVWPYHVSELKRWNSNAAKTYSVTGIPMNFLIDKEGKVIAKNLRGENLKTKLEELMVK